MAISGYDPGVELSSAPILSWARAVWGQLVDRNEVLLPAWRQAMRQVGLARQPFRMVKGPAGAFVASALRIGWQVPSPTVVVAARGEVLSLDEACPVTVGQCAERDFLTWAAAQSSLADEIRGIPDLEPLRDAIRQLGVHKLPTAVAG